MADSETKELPEFDFKSIPGETEDQFRGRLTFTWFGHTEMYQKMQMEKAAKQTKH
jgi:hypothetical protein